MSNFIDTILNPRSIAFFGANEDLMKMGSTQLLNIKMAGYRGRIIPIHPKLHEVQGFKAYASILDVPDAELPDIFFIVLPGKYVPRVLEECGSRGVTRGVVVSAGFRELGDDGLQSELTAVSKKYGLKFFGPNCFGFFNNHVSAGDGTSEMTSINTTWLSAYNPPRGGVSIASQSGTYMSHIFMIARDYHMGFSKTLSLGNEATIDLVDALEYFENDTFTHVIGLYIEEIKRPKDFINVARRVVKKKPIIVLYVGGTRAGGRAVSSHTGSMAGNDEIFNAMARQTGIIRAYTMNDWLIYCHALDTCPLPRGDRVAILTNSGGPGANMADSAERMGLHVPVFSGALQAKLKEGLVPTAQVKNIVDLTFDFDISKFYSKLPKDILKSGEVDGLLVYGIFGSSFFERMERVMVGLKFPREELEAMLFPMLKMYARLPKKHGIPIIASNLLGREDNAVAFLQEHGFPVFKTPNQAVKAFWVLHEYARLKQKFEMT
ncbi:MAG: acetate--CoA ligase family protein [Promethearchaeota archaeon]